MAERENLEPMFLPYDRVRLRNEPGQPTAIVTDYTFRWADEACTVSTLVYTLHVDDGRTVTAQEDVLEWIGRLEAPLRDFEVVEIFPLDANLAYLAGRTGTVEGSSYDPTTGTWAFAVRLNGEGWAFNEAELRGTGIIDEN